MQIRDAVLAALAVVPLSGCSSIWNCHPDTENFSLDQEVTAEQLDDLVARGFAEQDSWDTLACETVCASVYSNPRGWEGVDVRSCTLTLPDNPDGSGEPGQVVCEGVAIEYYCEGRRPLGHVEGGDERCPDPLGRSLAAMAYLEAASVLAFEQLAAQLQAWHAPPELIARCRAAALDEQAHARWLAALAVQRGASVPTPKLERGDLPADRFTVAMHNAVEGCVHESFSALLAACYSRAADSRVLRRVFARLAVDEARHGQLAWDLHEWLRGQLSADAAAQVDLARTQALAQLHTRARELARLPSELGPPSPEQAEALAQAFVEQLAA
jgi:hypothetical protein